MVYSQEFYYFKGCDFINFDRKTGIIRKFQIIMVVIVVFFFTGCIKIHTADFVKTFNKYLTYSLGDFKSDKRIVQNSPGPIPQVYKYIEWTLKYKDTNGNDKTFVFNNATDESKNNKMAIQVYMQANDVCSDEIGANVCSKYFDYISDESKVSIEDLPVTYILVNGARNSTFSDSFYAECINKEHGLKLSSITANELKDKWKGTFKISIITAETKEEQLNAILDKTKSLLKDFSEYLNLDSVTASINYSKYALLYEITYDNKKSTFKVEDIREEEAKKQGKQKTSLKSDNYIDGHIEYIRTYIVNNKKLVWLDAAKYDKETKMYYLGSYIQLLRALGIEVQENLKNGGYKYKWQIGDDIFDAYISYPEKILKNNLEIAHPRMGYQVHGSGISVKEFELISNATVAIDEKKEAVIINKK